MMVPSGKQAYLKVTKKAPMVKCRATRAFAEIRNFMPGNAQSDPQFPEPMKPGFVQGSSGTFSVWGPPEHLAPWLLSGNALLSAWEMELFETDPGFQLLGPGTPSAKHQEQGRCCKHICQPALMVSGTPHPPYPRPERSGPSPGLPAPGTC